MNDADLIALRISLARIAQTLGVDNDLLVWGKDARSLYILASTKEKGWNDLAGRIQERCEELVRGETK